MTLSWLDSIIEGTSEDESPREYYYWSSLAALAAVVKKNVYLDLHGKSKLYCNIFVFLVGPSGIRKGPPVAFAKEIVEAVGNTRVISGRSSVQAIVKNMGTSFTVEGGTIITDNSAFIASSEFASSLVADDQALTILTDLYDTHYNEKGWKNTLIGRENDTLKQPVLSMLGASNQIHLKEIISTRDVEGGFIARTFIVNASKRRTINSLVHKPTKVLDKDFIIEYLVRVSKLKGQFSFTPEAANCYDKWYCSMPEIEDSTGTNSRIHTSVLKIAMLLSLSKRFDLALTVDEIEEAIVVSADLIRHMNTVFMPGKGSETDLGKKITIVLQELINRPDRMISRQQLMSNHWGYLDSDSIDKVIETLVEPGIIRVEKQGNKAMYTFYHLTEAGYAAIVSNEERIIKGEGV